MNESRINKAISQAEKFPRTANPLVNPAYHQHYILLGSPLKLGDRWWMNQEGEIVKGKAKKQPHQRFYYTREQLLTCNLCVCDLCLVRLKQLRTASPQKAQQLKLKLAQHNTAHIQ